MLLFFPHLHPEFSSGELPEGGLFFDPGYTDESDGPFFRPGNLPIEPRTARKIVQDCMNFGEQFKDPHQLAYFGAQGIDDHYSETSFSIQSELIDRLKHSSKEEEDDSAERSKAQFQLLLAWFYEQRLIELQKIQGGVRESWDKFGQSLGVEAEDAREEKALNLDKTIANLNVPGMDDFVLPWKHVLAALVPFLPENAILAVYSPEAVEFWKESGVDFQASAGEAGLPQGFKLATVPARRLLGLAEGGDKRYDKVLTVAVTGEE